MQFLNRRLPLPEPGIERSETSVALVGLGAGWIGDVGGGDGEEGSIVVILGMLGFTSPSLT